MDRYIFDSNAEEREYHRLRMIEAANDPTTIALLEDTGIQPGWHCLELGPGAGSILRWLGNRTGPSGLAVGVDKRTTYLRDFQGPPFHVYEGTFLEVSFTHTFDLIHSRYVLIHNTDDLSILEKIFHYLRPGGIAVLEEPDFTSATLLDPAGRTPQGKVNLAISRMFLDMKLQPDYALRLPQKLETVGFRIVRTHSVMHLCPGQSPMANVMGESALVLQKEYCGTGLCSLNDIQHYVTLTRTPSSWMLYHSTTSVIVTKPHG